MLLAMVTAVFLNKCVAKGVFRPGTILRKIMYCRESHNKKLLNRVILNSQFWVWRGRGTGASWAQRRLGGHKTTCQLEV